MKGRATAGFWVATFRGFRAGLGEENVATTIDSIEFCTACHAEGRRFEPRRSRHFNFDDVVRAIYSDCNFLPPYPCKIIR